jgi:hypothetical protein
VSVGLVIALQGACVSALTGYETAEPGDVLDPASAKKLAQWEARETGLARGPRPAGRLAAVETLLRRVSSPEYLVDPERLDITRRRLDDALKLVEMRNAVVHFTGRGDIAESGEMRAPVTAACDIIGHLVHDRPAFDPAPHGRDLARISRDVEAIRAALLPAGG